MFILNILAIQMDRDGNPGVSDKKNLNPSP